MAASAPASDHADRWTAIADTIAYLDRPIVIWHQLCMLLWTAALKRALRG